MEQEKINNPFKIPVSEEVKKEITPLTEEKPKKKKDDELDNFVMPKGINIKLPPKLHNEFHIHCIKQGSTIQDYVLSWIRDTLKKNK